MLIYNSINIDYFERKKVFQSIVYRWRVDTGNHFVSSLIASLQQMTETESRDFDSGLKFRPFFSSFFNKEKGFQIFQNELIVFAWRIFFLQIWLCCLKNESLSHLVGSCGGSSGRSSGFMSSRSRVRIQTVFLLFFTMSRRSRALIPLEDSLYPLHISFISRSMIRSCQVSNIIAKFWINFVT